MMGGSQKRVFHDLTEEGIGSIGQWVPSHPRGLRRRIFVYTTMQKLKKELRQPFIGTILDSRHGLSVFIVPLQCKREYLRIVKRFT